MFGELQSNSSKYVCRKKPQQLTQFWRDKTAVTARRESPRCHRQ